MSVAADPQLGDPPDADGRFCEQPLTIPVTPTTPVERETECCCGRDSCAYLRHNNEALDGLEKDVRTAAQLGQVCGVLYSVGSPLFESIKRVHEPTSRASMQTTGNLHTSLHTRYHDGRHKFS
jgi:hypothetical protein